jgi:acylphosphatase
VIRRRLVIHGEVQGVFFRDTCRQEARARQVQGWVANRRDGGVEAVLEGDAPAVEAVIDWCRRGPQGAEVASVDVESEEPQGESGFEVRD